jgi:phosphoserine aminotransferase
MSEKISQRNLDMIQEIIDDVYDMYEFDHKTGRVGVNVPLTKKTKRLMKKAEKKAKKRNSVR